MRRINPIPLVVFGGFAAIAGLAAYHRNDPPAPPPPAPKISPEVEGRVRAELALEEISNNVRLVKTSWHLSGFNHVMVADFTIRNGNGVAVKDIVMKCDYYGPSGTLISTASDTIYRKFPPKADTTVEHFLMGLIHSQSATARCMVTHAAPES